MNFANIFWLNSDVLTELLHAFWSDNVIWPYTHNDNHFKYIYQKKKKNQNGPHLTFLTHVYGLIANDSSVHIISTKKVIKTFKQYLITAPPKTILFFSPSPLNVI